VYFCAPLTEIVDLTTTQTRHVAKKPASIFSPRPPPPTETVAANEGNNISIEPPSSATLFAPETKAVAQAIVSLLRPMASDIKDMANAQIRGAIDDTSESAADCQRSGYSYGLSEEVIMTDFIDGSSNSNPPSSGFGEQRRTLSPARRSSSQGYDGWSTCGVIPVDLSGASNRENETRQRLLRSLEGISAHLHDEYNA
jgi:hypothetical protein